jgi:hypothetical protein
MEEEWRDVIGYEGIYIISTLGRIKRIIPPKRLLKPSINHNGYMKIGLWKDGKGKYITLHRLVALNFIPNPYQYPCINHKDENKTNNAVDNLEWCTYKYNTNYGRCIERRRNSTDYSDRMKKVKQIKNGKIINEFPSVVCAAKSVNGLPCVIGNVCRKMPHRKTAYGYQWEYK